MPIILFGMSDAAGKEGDGTSESTQVTLPYDKNTGQVRLITSLNEIVEFDRKLREITEGLPRPVRLGSILRLPEIAYQNWGIGITDGNRSQLAALASSFYLMDAEESRIGRFDNDDLHWLKKDLASGTQESMATFISRFVREAMLSMDDGSRTFRIANVASGRGRLCSAVVTALQDDPDSEKLLERTEFHLVDSSEKLARAENNLRGLGIRTVSHTMTDGPFLSQSGEEFDFVLALSHLHRKPFLAGYLSRVHSRLSEGGLLISGDWHSTLCHTPSYVYELLERLGLENNRLNLFDELMGPLMREKPQSRDFDETFAISDHLNYWHNLYWELGKRSYDGGMKVRILGAFVSTKQLAKQMEDAGFTTDHAQIRKAFPRAKLPSQLPLQVRNGSDTAALSVGLKRRRGG
jgi:hypothetical protein